MRIRFLHRCSNQRTKSLQTTENACFQHTSYICNWYKRSQNTAAPRPLNSRCTSNPVRVPDFRRLGSILQAEICSFQNGRRTPSGEFSTCNKFHTILIPNRHQLYPSISENGVPARFFFGTFYRRSLPSVDLQ